MSRHPRWVWGALSILWLFSAHQASAQSLAVGLKGGLTTSTLKIEATDLIISPSAILGAEAGVFVVRDLFGSVIGQVEGLLSQKGTVIRDDPRYDGDLNVRVNYLDVPVLLGYRLSLSRTTAVHALGGAVLSFRLGDRQRMGDDVLEEGEKQAFTNTDFGLSVGGAVTFGRFVVDARYVFGVSNINDDVDRDELTVRNRTFNVSVGWRWK